MNKLVYRHRREDNNEIFYVGIGNEISKKKPYKIEIIAKDLNFKDACELECLLIKEYGRIDLKTGSLSNLTDGGEGVVNLSKKAKLKISLSNTGKIRTNENIQKLKDNHKGMLGKKHSEKTIDLMRYGKKNLRGILQYDLNNNYVNEFKSIEEAKRYLGKKSMAISNCLSGMSKSAFGFKWKYKKI